MLNGQSAFSLLSNSFTIQFVSMGSLLTVNMSQLQMLRGALRIDYDHRFHEQGKA